MVSHICLLVELGLICNSMAAPLCLKSCEDHSLLKSYNGGLWKIITGLGPKALPGHTHFLTFYDTFLNYVSHVISLTMLR